MSAIELLEILSHADVLADVVAAVTTGEVSVAEQLIQGAVIGAPAAIIAEAIGLITSHSSQETPDPKHPASAILTAKKRPIALSNPEDIQAVSKRIRFDSHESDSSSLSNMPGRSINQIRFPRGGQVGDEEVDVVPPPKRIALSAPDYFTIDLPYVVTAHVTTVKANSINDFVFKLNSVFDPQTTSTIGTEHQPMGRDLWAGVYQYYRVLKSNFTVTAVNYTPNEAVTASSHPACILGLTPQESTSPTITTREALMESKISQWQILHPVETNHHSGSLSFDYNPESWEFHVQESGIDERWTPIGSNPAIIHYIMFHTANMFDGDVKPLNIQFTVTMKFTVQFREANSTYIHTIDAQ